MDQQAWSILGYNTRIRWGVRPRLWCCGENTKKAYLDLENSIRKTRYNISILFFTGDLLGAFRAGRMATAAEIIR